ncbi:putative corticotropin-releasing factor-binding protein isoform X2 [Penaeus vannamei]|uniref:Putative corticotropin-releasing factor-binding protein isoform X2 n=1 Tax=Penaeus vannamei TaxID=6689 RepID=A0A3R7PFJ3_PENVA|nr:putative corticotropin-releasing factor-binding protein isoform X2 [Penaeus vannamei]
MALPLLLFSKLSSLSCNILVDDVSGLYTLRNHGRRSNCSITTIFPASVSIAQIAVGIKGSLVPNRAIETGVLSRCEKRGSRDYVQIGGAQGLDVTKLEVEDSVCGLDSNPRLPASHILCGMTTVRMVSSGLTDNSITLAISQISDFDIMPTLMCDLPLLRPPSFTVSFLPSQPVSRLPSEVLQKTSEPKLSFPPAPLISSPEDARPLRLRPLFVLVSSSSSLVHSSLLVSLRLSSSRRPLVSSLFVPLRKGNRIKTASAITYSFTHSSGRACGRETQSPGKTLDQPSCNIRSVHLVAGSLINASE